VISISFEDLKARVKAGEVTAIELEQPYRGLKTLRLFNSVNDQLCYFPKGGKRRGYWLPVSVLDNVQAIVAPKPKKDPDLAKYATIAKFHKYATRATFTNPFIRACLALPETFEQWVSEGKKGLYDYHVTSGTRIDGQVISLESFAKKYPHHVAAFRRAWEAKTDFSMGRARFRGYDATVGVWKYGADSNGDPEWTAGLSLEYKGCGNGYYYQLIDDDHFIGVDID
jgi:hypothetical protein